MIRSSNVCHNRDLVSEVLGKLALSMHNALSSLTSVLSGLRLAGLPVLVHLYHPIRYKRMFLLRRINQPPVVWTRGANLLMKSDEFEYESLKRISGFMKTS
jgi:hypothetical protein